MKTLVLSSVLIFLVACSQPSEFNTLDLAAIKQLSINNFAHQKESLFTGGQPSQEELTALAEAGIQHVINLRPVQEQKQEQEWNEAELVQSLNMQYHSIPIAGAAGVSIENATKLAELIKSLEGESVFLHCSSSNRVGALTALYEGAVNGVNYDQAIAKGKRWGLGSLEPVVRAQLANPH